jgi:transcriptional regulator with XRE-family HTH domain
MTDMVIKMTGCREGPAPSPAESDLMRKVADRVRVWRRERRLSLDRLAARAGVSKGIVVQLEKGTANPSISTICKVAAALGASVADLVQASTQQDAEVIPAGSPRVLMRGPKGGRATFLVGSTGPDMLELWSWELKPGERHDSPAHPEGTQELIHVLKGTLTLAFPSVSYVVEAGAAAVAFTDRRHAYACAGKTPVSFTMVVAEWHRPRSGRRTRASVGRRE